MQTQIPPDEMRTHALNQAADRKQAFPPQKKQSRNRTTTRKLGDTSPQRLLHLTDLQHDMPHKEILRSVHDSLKDMFHDARHGNIDDPLHFALGNALLGTSMIFLKDLLRDLHGYTDALLLCALGKVLLVNIHDLLKDLLLLHNKFLLHRALLEPHNFNTLLPDVQPDHISS